MIKTREIDQSPVMEHIHVIDDDSIGWAILDCCQPSTESKLAPSDTWAFGGSGCVLYEISCALSLVHIGRAITDDSSAHLVETSFAYTGEETCSAEHDVL